MMKSFKSFLRTSIQGRKTNPASPIDDTQDILERGPSVPASTMPANQDHATTEHGPMNPLKTGISTLKRMPGEYPALNEVTLPKVRIITQDDKQNIARLQAQQREIETLLMQLRENYAAFHRLNAEKSDLSAEHQQNIQQLRSELGQATMQGQLLMQERDSLLAHHRLKQAEKAEAISKAGSSRILEGSEDKETREKLQALLQERDSQLAKDRGQLRDAMKRGAEALERAEMDRRLLTEANERAEANRQLLAEANERTEALDRRLLAEANERAEAERLLAEANERTEALDRRLLAEVNQRAEESERRLLAEANERTEADRRLLEERAEADLQVDFPAVRSEEMASQEGAHLRAASPISDASFMALDSLTRRDQPTGAQASNQLLNQETHLQEAELGRHLARSRDSISKGPSKDRKSYSAKPISDRSFMAMDSALRRWQRDQATDAQASNQLLNDGPTSFFERPFVMPPLRFLPPKGGAGLVLYGLAEPQDRNLQSRASSSSPRGEPSAIHQVEPLRLSLPKGTTRADGLQHTSKSPNRNSVSAFSQSSPRASHSPIPVFPRHPNHETPRRLSGVTSPSSALVGLSSRSGSRITSPVATPASLPATRSATPRGSSPLVPMAPKRSSTPLTPRRNPETPRIRLPGAAGHTGNSMTPRSSSLLSSRGESRSSMIDLTTRIRPNSLSLEAPGDGDRTTPASKALSIDDSISDAAGAAPESGDEFVGERLAIVERKLDQVFDVLHQNEQTRPGPTTQRKSLPAQRFRRGPARARDPRRTTLLNIVRGTMNKHLGIKRDAEIIKVQLATEDEVSAYEEDGQGAAVQPFLNPMHPDLQNPWSCWNARLWDLLATELLDAYEIDDDTMEEMKTAFHKRLGQLSQRLKRTPEGELGTDDDSEAEEHAQLQQEKEARNKHRQRAGTRRRTLFSIRKEITKANRRNPSEHSSEAWGTLDRAVAVLYHEGMSSDESGTEDNQQKVYLVKKMPWRAKLLTSLLRHLDEDRNANNGFGGRQPGNAPRTRVVTRRATATSREAPPGLPINFYDNRWYHNLTYRDQQELKPEEQMDLPLVDDLKYQ